VNGRLQSDHDHRQKKQADDMRQNADAKSGQKIEPGRSPNAENEFFGDTFHGPNAFPSEQDGFEQDSCKIDGGDGNSQPQRMTPASTHSSTNALRDNP
jgi:hypothetical protein